MQLRILAASSSLSRRLWYRNELELRGCQVETADSGIACIERALTFRPQALILESFLTWGGSDGVLAVREVDPRLKAVHVVVVDLQRDAAQTYRLGAYELAGYWKWPPTADELVDAVRATVSSERSRQYSVAGAL